MNRTKHWIGTLVAGLLVIGAAVPAHADKVNCADEFRSGKLYFSQELFDKSVGRFATAVNTCGDRGEYRWRYAIALCERGNEILEAAFVTAETRAEQEQLKQEALDMFQLAGVQFDSSAIVETKKKNLKNVRENRKHYWVKHYNRGLKLFKDENFGIAALEFQIARFLDSGNPKAYAQAAVSLIRLEKEEEAAGIVEAGLEADPDDKQLNDLMNNLFERTARRLIEESQEGKDVDKARDAGKYLAALHERKGDDPNILFLMGVSKLAEGSATVSAAGNTTPEAREIFESAAESFGKASSEVAPDGENRDFYLNAVFNRIQAQVNAENYEAAMGSIQEYLGVDHTDPSIWRLLSGLLIKQDDTERAVAALMVSKSLGGDAIATDAGAVKTAVANATGDAKTALASHGEPEMIYGYQEPDSGNQIQTWLWPGKRMAMSFILGDKNGEITW